VSVRVATARGTPAGPSSAHPVTAAGTRPALGTTDAPFGLLRTVTTRGRAATTRRSRRTCVPATSTARHASG
jgi:hypothetical protein